MWSFTEVLFSYQCLGNKDFLFKYCCGFQNNFLYWLEFGPEFTSYKKGLNSLSSLTPLSEFYMLCLFTYIL